MDCGAMIVRTKAIRTRLRRCKVSTAIACDNGITMWPRTASRHVTLYLMHVNSHENFQFSNGTLFTTEILKFSCRKPCSPLPF